MDPEQQVNLAAIYIPKLVYFSSITQNAGFWYICPLMRSIKATILLLLFGCVLAHAAVPHHHHLEPPVKEHHHHDADHHHHDDGEGDHSVFTFSQIDDIFLHGKQITVPIVIAFIPTPSFTVVISEEDATVEYFEKDIHRPPLISIPQHPFRGPPTFS